MHRRQVIKKLDRILKLHYKHLYNRVYYKLGSDGQTAGIYNTLTRNICITFNKKTDERELIQTVFHELGHGFCIKYNKWPSYHTLAICDKNEAKRYVNTSLKAERWVDRWAEKEMKKHFPQLKYKALYFTPHGVEFNKKHVSYIKNLFL